MNIVITGASKGIGYELTKLFAKNENNTVIGIARSESLLKKLKDECDSENSKNKFRPLVLDIEDYEKMKSNLRNEIERYVDSVDILINNAGFLVNKPFAETQINDINKTFNINLISPSVIIQSLIPLLKLSNVKHVVNISSMGGYQGSAKFPGLSFYSASKAALASLTECLAEEYKNDEISFNCLALGAVNTEMLKTAFPDYTAPINPNEMASFIYDFAINGYKYLNGKILPVSLTTP